MFQIRFLTSYLIVYLFVDEHLLLRATLAKESAILCFNREYTKSLNYIIVLEIEKSPGVPRGKKYVFEITNGVKGAYSQLITLQRITSTSAKNDTANIC